MLLAGVAIIIGGFLFSEMFLRIVYTSKWATPSAVSIMHCYCVYCLFMALNGITEAYIYAKANEKILRKL